MMTNKTFSCIIKGTALAASWLTLSPLLLILDGRWKLLPKWLRIVLFVLSPLMLVVFFVLGIMAYFYYQDYWRKYHFVRPRVIENITGVRMPKYKVIERNLNSGPFDVHREGRPYRSRLEAWMIDFQDTFVLEFKDMPDSTFYQDLKNKGFDHRDGCYYFHLNWGSGLVKDEVVPKGEKGNFDYTMTICEGEKTAAVRVMEL